jgi:hypothetical protein
MIMEDIGRGERVPEYIIDGRAPGSEWVQLGAGQSIGHKRSPPFRPGRYAENLDHRAGFTQKLKCESNDILLSRGSC